MSSSESEHSLNDVSLQSHNRAVIFMKHCSENEENDNGDDSYDDDENLSVINSDKFNKNYFTMAYTDNESTALKMKRMIMV